MVSTLITGSPACLVVLGLLVDVAELGVPVRVLLALDGLGVGLQAEALLAQQVADRVRADPVPLAVSSAARLRVDFVVHRSGDIGSPRIVRLDQRQQRRPAAPDQVGGPLAAPARPPHPPQRLLPGLQLAHAQRHRGLR